MAMETKSGGVRVNARFDEDLAAKLDQLKRRTGESTSDLLKRGVNVLFRQEVVGEASDPLKGFFEAGFVGSGEGPPDLSERVKEEYTALLEEKHGYR